MALITQNLENEQRFSNRAYDFFKRYKIEEILHKSNAFKYGGIAVVTVVMYLFLLVFRFAHKRQRQNGSLRLKAP